MKDEKENYSPDKRFKLTFDNFIEPRIGMNMSRFSLTDTQTNETEIFIPLWTAFEGWGTSWSNDSLFFSIPIGDPIDCFFIYDINQRKFSSINIANVWILDGHCHADYIEIEYRDDQIPESKEHNKYPTKNYSKPTNLQFKFAELHWKDIQSLQQFVEINKNEIVYDLDPIDNGWREFKGQLPQTTEVLVWELEEFAKYGDRQSKEWFDEIKSKTEDINYWINASKYLGTRKRKENTAANSTLPKAGRSWWQKLIGSE